MATGLARIFEDDHAVETLIMCPKNLVRMWEDYRQQYRLRAEVLSITQAQCKLPDLRRFHEDELISLRTTNIIERLNKEFKRRTKTIEILAGETACYRLLAFISIKVELHWQSSHIGKGRKNLPCFQKIACENLHN
jgi:transposase-like protein